MSIWSATFEGHFEQIRGNLKNQEDSRDQNLKITTFKLTYSIVVKSDGFETEPFVHKGSIANPLKIVNISFCSLLFHGLLKFMERIGQYQFLLVRAPPHA